MARKTHKKIKIYRRRDGKEYVITGIMIEKDIYDKMIEIAPTLYGKGRGWLSWAVNEALRYWLAPRAHTRHANPPRSIWEKFNHVKRRLAEIMGIPEHYRIYECTEKQLELAIALAIGSDRRTIRKYKKLFMELGLIRDMTPHLPEGRKVFEVLG